MPFCRKISHLDTDAQTVLTVLNDACDAAVTDRVESASFELLRHGGCGAGEIVLNDLFTDRGSIVTGQYVLMEYTAGDAWFRGRVESIEESSPTRVVVSLYGMWGELNEVFPGGFGAGNENAPHVYGRTHNLVFDPDFSIQSFESANQPEAVITKLFTTYISPATNVTLGTIESPTTQAGVHYLTLRGEESAAEIIRLLAMLLKDANFGVDADRKLFVTQRKSAVLKTYHEAVNLEQLSRSTDTSLLFNRMTMLGGYVYLTSSQFFRYRATFVHRDSVGRNGERRIRLYIPWLRNNNDAKEFAREFFRTYANPTTRYITRTNGQTAIIKPWDGQVRLHAADDSVLVTDRFDSLRVEFDHVPIFEIGIGPEDIQFPSAPELDRFEVGPAGNLPGISIPSLSTFDSVEESAASSATSVSVSGSSLFANCCEGDAPLCYEVTIAAGPTNRLCTTPNWCEDVITGTHILVWNPSTVRYEKPIPPTCNPSPGCNAENPLLEIHCTSGIFFLSFIGPTDIECIGDIGEDASWHSIFVPNRDCLQESIELTLVGGDSSPACLDYPTTVTIIPINCP